MKKIILTASILATLIGTSCKKKTSESPVTEEVQPTAISSSEGKGIMTGSKDAMKNDVVALTKGQGMTQLTNMSDVIMALDPSEPISLARVASGEEIDPKEMAELLAKQAKVFKKLFFPESVISSLNRTEDNTNADFEKNWGNYEWNNSTETWTKTTNSKNNITISFPSDSTKRTVNDAVFTLTNYSEKATSKMEGSKMSYDTLPTSIIADLKIKNALVASINYTGAFSNDGTPTALNGSIFLSPFTYSASFTDNGSTVTGSSKLLRDAAVVAGIGTTVSLKGTGDDRTATSLTGYVQYRDIKMAGSVVGLDSESEDSTIALVNKHFDIDMVRASDNQKIADVDIAERKTGTTKDADTEAFVRMTYTDGTTEDIVNYLKPATDELEKFLEDQSK